MYFIHMARLTHTLTPSRPYPRQLLRKSWRKDHVVKKRQMTRKKYLAKI